MKEPLSCYILASLLSGQKPAGEIQKRLTGLGYTISAGALYEGLRRLVAGSAVKAIKQPPRNVKGGRGRYLYEITKDGRKYLATVLDRVKRATYQ